MNCTTHRNGKFSMVVFAEVQWAMGRPQGVRRGAYLAKVVSRLTMGYDQLNAGLFLRHTDDSHEYDGRSTWNYHE